MMGRIVCATLALAGVAHGQKFEVASVKLTPDMSTMSDRERSNCGSRLDAGRVQLRCAALSALIARAYEIEPFQLHGPEWMPRVRVDVIATLPQGTTEKDVPAMLRDLLAERFHLKVRRESREEQVYALVAGKDGPKLKDAPTGDLTSDHPFPEDRKEGIAISIGNFGVDGWQTYSMKSATDRTILFEARRITAAGLARVVAGQVDLPVIDQTGLKGAYEVAMLVPGGPNAHRAGAGSGRGGVAPVSENAAEPSGVNLFKSLEKLGLALEKRKAEIEHVVVEELEKQPTEN